MKKLIIISTIFLLSAGIILLDSCKKLDTLKGIPDHPVIYAVQAAQQTYPINVQMIAGAQSYVFTAGYGGLKEPSAPIAVTFAVDTAALAQFNANLIAGGTPPYLALPAANYSFSSLSGTIPAGGLSSELLYLKINSAGMNSIGKYALALTLGVTNSKDSVNQDTKTVIFTIDGLNNIYAGAYAARGVRTNYNANGTVSAVSTFNFIKNLTTVSADTSAIDAVANLGANRSNTVFKVAVDAGNKVNISGYIDNPANPIINEPGTTSTYDPVAKTFYLSYRYTLTTNGGIYRVMTDTLTKQ